jgi:hypothetical protein
VAPANADRTVRVDFATLVGLGLAVFAFYAGLRDLSLVRRLLEMPHVRGIDLLLSAPEVLTGLLVPAIGLLVLAVALGYVIVFDRRSLLDRRSITLLVLTVSLLYWSGDVAFAATGIVLAGVVAVLDGVSVRTRAGDS